MRAPYFWSGKIDPQSREAAPVLRALLTPLAALSSGITARRLRSVVPTELNIPVICVGNLTVGGSGKTPLVETIRERLTSHGLRAASLSRGHGGRFIGPHRVDADAHSAADVGDEPLLLAMTGEAWISRDRAIGGDAMEAEGVDIIVMDDGHQNPQLRKDLSIVVIDTDDPIGNGYVIPKGPLREPAAKGLKRADAVLLTGDGECPPWLENAEMPVLKTRLKHITPLPTGPLIAFAGIGKPEKFFAILEKEGAVLGDTVCYGDHHVYSNREMTFLHNLASDHGARLVTTEKDFVRLSKEHHSNVQPIKVKASFENEAELDDLLYPLIDRVIA
ncbi:MAG: tetraacyldisaccharide 4'-kinase [Pseudomonadota bacterium]